MKISKRQLQKIIKEYKGLGGVVDVEMEADAALRQLLDTYLEDTLRNESGSNREDALEQAFADVKDFVAGFESAVRYEEKNAEFKVR